MVKLKKIFLFIFLAYFDVPAQATDLKEVATNLALEQAVALGYEKMDNKFQDLGNTTNSTAGIYSAAQAAKFGTFGTLAIAMRNYFGSYLSIIPKVKLAEQISKFVNLSPELKSVPLNVLFKAIEISVFYGSSIGLEALDQYLSTASPAAGKSWLSSIATIMAWTAIVKLAEGLKQFTDVPTTIELQPDTSINKPTYFQRFKGATRYAYETGKSLAKHSARLGALAGTAVVATGRDMGYLATLKLSEYIGELAQKVPTPKDYSFSFRGHKITIPGAIIKNITLAGMLYGSSYAVAAVDEYLLNNYGINSELATSMAWASISTFTNILNFLWKTKEVSDEPKIS
jgi:hypothetical protein